MKKSRLFIENFFVYGVGGIIGKIVPLIMLPIVTRLMPDTFYFGLNDLSHTLVSFCQAFAIMGMYDAMYRMFFEKEDVEFKTRICSTALIFTLCTSTILFIVLMVFREWFSALLFSDKQYANLILLSAISVLVGSTNSIVTAPTRMQNRKNTYLAINTVSTVASYAISIPLLMKGYYIIALPLAAVVTALSSEIVYMLLNRKWFKLSEFDKGILHQLLIIGLPLLPNFLIYWVFNSSDRIMIAKILGNEYAGIYAIGAKLGACSQLVYTAFAGGWQYFAFATMKDKNQVKSNSLIYEYLGIISFIAAAFVMALSFPIYKLLFTGEYITGYVASGYLFLAPLLLMLYQVSANQFLVVKKTWPNALILSCGAAVNVALNLLLIPCLGVEGAAIATLIGYVVSDVVCCFVLTKMKLIFVSKRFIVSSVVMGAFILIWRLFFRENWIAGVILATVLTVVLAVLYLNEIKTIWRAFKNRKKAEV